MNDYQIKDILVQFCVMIHCLNDMAKNISEMQKSIRIVLDKVESIKEGDNNDER